MAKRKLSVHQQCFRYWEHKKNVLLLLCPASAFPGDIWLVTAGNRDSELDRPESARCFLYSYAFFVPSVDPSQQPYAAMQMLWLFKEHWLLWHAREHLTFTKRRISPGERRGEAPWEEKNKGWMWCWLWRAVTEGGQQKANDYTSLLLPLMKAQGSKSTC